jgi:hypothetical protein
MGFIHHTTGASGATGLMGESARSRGSASFKHPHLPAPPASAARIGGRPPCNADRAAAAGESLPGHVAIRPIPAIRFGIVKGQDH